MAVKVYKTILMQQVMKGNAVENAVRPLAKKAARQKIDHGKRQALRMFNAHPVTREIEGGGTADNISDTLHFPEAAKKGNLYSFIGFPGIGAANIAGIRMLFSSYSRLGRVSKGIVRGNEIHFNANAKLPNLHAFYQITPMPWPEGGQSWAQKIETGFSNLHFYKYKKGVKSRSGYAIQLEKWGVYLPGSYYKPKNYLSGIVSWWHNMIQRRVEMTVRAINAGTAMKGGGRSKMPIRPGEENWRNPFGKTI
jgi:hypothetical protein